jgi:ELWxxDGT repeat protein
MCCQSSPRGMNKAHVLLFALMMMTVSLAGCFGGDDGGSNDETTTETLDDWQVHFAASSSDLPECNGDTNGRLYYVEADGEFQVCSTSGWEVIEISGTDGADGSSSTSTLIRTLSSTSCITGGSTFEIGSDSNSDGVLDASEVGITVDICNGSQGPEGPAGADGDDGADALNALVSSSPEASGNNCANGGTRIDVGVDDNADGVLDATEIDQTQYVCNGGSSNNTMLTSISSPLSNMGCDAGGRTVSYGLDNGDGAGTYANGVLEPGEVDASTTLCSRYSTVLFRDINAGSGNGYFESTFGQNNVPTRSLIAVGNTLFMAANDGTNGLELWKSDGTASGTVMVKDINTGTGDGITTAFAFGPTMTAFGTTLYFVANDGTNGDELWKSDGTANGTMMVKDIDNGSGSSYPYSLTAVGNTLFFQASDGTNGYELWKSDGTTNGTMMVKDIDNGSGSSNPSYLTAVGNTLFFQASDGTNGYELWKSDGTATGTMMVKDINNGSSSSDPSSLTAFGNTLYFRANDGTNGTELWKSDGTATGTVLTDINNGSGGSYPFHFTVIGNTLYFTADDGTNGGELWKSDGTANGTMMVKDIYNGIYSSNAYALTALGNTLYFSASDGTNGSELWKSDGTANGTMMIKDINSGSDPSMSQFFTAVGNTLYFQAHDGTNGVELWESDGTALGTVLVKDIRYASGSSNPNDFAIIGNTLYFTANDGYTGIELYSNTGLDTEVIYS